MRSPSEQKNLQQRFNSWIPEGVWSINGKLDPNFVDWLAKDWMKSYGGDFHRKRADVLRHFKKDPANIAIALEKKISLLLSSSAVSVATQTPYINTSRYNYSYND